jgi:hypothetical protein
MLNEHLENLIKIKIQDKTVLNTKGTELTLKLSTDMVSHLENSSLKLIITNFSLKTQGKDFGSIRAYQGKETGMRNEQWDGLFIRKVHHQLFDRVTNVR